MDEGDERVKDGAIALAIAAATALGAQASLALPFSPVPVTAQSLMLLAAAASVGPWRAALGAALYVALGLVLPFYAGGRSGEGVLVGATGGYLLALPLAALATGALRPRIGAFGAAVVGHGVLLALGAAWLATVIGSDAIAKGVLPFLPGALVKSVLIALTVRWRSP